MCAYARAHEQSMPLEMSWASNARHARGRAALGSAGWHTHTRACMFTEARAYTQAHVHTHTAPEFTCTPGISSHSRAGVWRCFAQISMCVPETCACTQHAHTHTRTHTQEHTRMQTHTHAHTHTHTHAHTHSNASVRTWHDLEWVLGCGAAMAIACECAEALAPPPKGAGGGALHALLLLRHKCTHTIAQPVRSCAHVRARTHDAPATHHSHTPRT